MATEFSNGELKLLFQRIDEKLDDIKSNMGRYDNNIENLEKEVVRVEKKIDRLATIGATIWASLTIAGSYLLQRLF